MNIKTKYGEKVGDIVVKSSTLKSINCPLSLIPSTIDEFTILMNEDDVDIAFKVIKNLKKL